MPAGTPINVRLTQAIDVDSSQAGMNFKGVVDDPVMIGGSIVIPRGASAMLQAVKVEQSGKMKGSDKITLKLNAVSFGGMVHQVATTYVETKGKGEGKKTGRKVARRRRARRHRRRDRRRRRGSGDRCCHRRRYWRRGVGRRRGAPAAARRNAPAVSAQRRGEHPIVTLRHPGVRPE